MSPSNAVAKVSTATLQQTAKRYHSFGWNVLPQDLHKKPLIDWIPWQETPQTEEFVKEMPWAGADAISVMAGVGNLRALDLDEACDAVLYHILSELGLRTSYKFVEKSGSGKGWHIYFQCEGELPITSTMHDGHGFTRIELKWKHCTSTISPSRHESGGKYEWLRGEPTFDDLLALNLEDVLRVYKSVSEPTCKGKPAAYPDEIQPRVATVRETPTDIDPKWEEAFSQFPLVSYLHEKCGGDLEPTEDGQTRITGNGGLIVDESCQRWKRFSPEMGGGVLDAISWAEFDEPDHKALTPEQTKTVYKILQEKSGVSLAKPRKHVVTMQGPALPLTPEQLPSGSIMTPLGKVVELKDLYVDADSFLNTEDEPHKWVVDQVIARGEIWSIFGAPGAGKSEAVNQLGVSVASGITTEWLGFKIVEHCPVIHVLLDGSPRSLRNRIRKVARFLNVDKLPNWKQFIPTGPFGLWRDRMEALLNLVKPGLIVIDCLAMASGAGDENQVGEQKEMADVLILWAQKYDLAIVLVHHSNKLADSLKMNQRNFRGSSFWVGLVSGLCEFRLSKSDSSYSYYNAGLKLRDGDPKVLCKTLQAQYVHSFDGQGRPTGGFVFKNECTEEDHMGNANSTGGQSKVFPRPWDVMKAGEELTSGALLDQIMVYYGKGMSWAKELKAHWIDTNVVLTRKERKGESTIVLHSVNPNGTQPISNSQFPVVGQ